MLDGAAGVGATGPPGSTVDGPVAEGGGILPGGGRSPLPPGGGGNKPVPPPTFLRGLDASPFLFCEKVKEQPVL